MVDATYRADLRELNELNFARFDAKLEQRMVGLESRLEQRIAVFESSVDQRLAGLEVKLERRLGEQTRWLFIAWASLLIPIFGLYLRR